MRILFTGGSGRLGKQLIPILESKGHFIIAPAHKDLNIIEDVLPYGPFDIIIHTAGYTNVKGAETNKELCFKTNVVGTLRIVAEYGCPIVYISSEYAHKPINFYALTKSLAEQIVTTHLNYLIIRTLFKERPFPYPTAYIDQYTQGDYIDVIAPLIAQEVISWDHISKLVYIGTGRKTIYDLAIQSREVKPISVKDIKGVQVPVDYL